MTVSFDDLLFGPVHDILSVTATITPTTSASAADVYVIDKTGGVVVQQQGPEGLATTAPAAIVRSSALAAAGLARSDLRRASLSMNGKTYRIESTEPRPSPGGEADGELYLILSEG